MNMPFDDVDANFVEMPGDEEKELVVNDDCVDAAAVAIGCLQVNYDDELRLVEVDRRAALGEKSDWRAYSTMFLAVDENKPEDTRMRFQVPVAKAGVVYAKAVKRACTHEVKEVADAAFALARKMNLVSDSQSVRRPQRGDFSCPVMQGGRSCPMNGAGRCCHLGDDGACKIAKAECPLSAGTDKAACPVMSAGEGCPMDQWSGCAQLDEDGGCKLRDGEHCCFVKEEEDGEEE